MASARGACRMETQYYEVYNQPNVELVDIKDTPIERITPNGLKTSEREFEFDMIIYATGFDADHRQLRPDRHSRRGRPTAESGMDRRDARRSSACMVAGFPNMFMLVGPAHGARQHPAQHRVQCRMGADLIQHMRANGHTLADCTADADGSLDGLRLREGRGAAVERGRFLDDRASTSTSRASRRARSRATVALRRNTGRGVTRWRQRVTAS